jgi:hypothetical membrane protein
MLLVVSGGFCIGTWAVGGQSGYTTGVGLAVPWIVTVMVAFLAIVGILTKDVELIFDLLLTLFILSFIDFGIMPISALSLGSITVSALVVATSLVAYIGYIICSLTRHPEKSTRNKIGVDTTPTSILKELTPRPIFNFIGNVDVLPSPVFTI